MAEIDLFAAEAPVLPAETIAGEARSTASDTETQQLQQEGKRPNIQGIHCEK